MANEKDERPFSELSRAERREQARKMLFGNSSDEYMGNIWGWRFSLFSFVGLLLVGALAFYGAYTGKIDMNQQLRESERSSFQQQPLERPKTGVKDTLN